MEGVIAAARNAARQVRRAWQIGEQVGQALQSAARAPSPLVFVDGVHVATHPCDSPDPADVVDAEVMP